LQFPSVPLSADAFIAIHDQMKTGCSRKKIYSYSFSNFSWELISYELQNFIKTNPRLKEFDKICYNLKGKENW
jgi:hypothetical protein